MLHAMAIFKRILVATDFGEASERALELALELAVQFDSELTLIHVWEFPSYEYMGAVPAADDLAERIAEAANAQMASTIGLLKPRCSKLNSIVRMGHAASELLSCIEEIRPDLLVLGTHGRRGFKRALLGSVAEKLVRCSPIPVLTVRGQEES